jgi:hypothetical protein
MALCSRTVFAVLVLVGCNSQLPPAGPSAAYLGVARPRNPDHFQLGNGTNAPQPYAMVQSFAVSQGVSGMASFQFRDWMRPSGTVKVTPVGRATRYQATVSGLVPGGFYTAWLVRVKNSTRGPKTDLPLGTTFDGAPPTNLTGTNGIRVLANGTAAVDVTLTPEYTTSTGIEYVHIDRWDEIHLAFHADNVAHGSVPGANHWTQIVLPIREHDGSDAETLVPPSSEQFSMGNGTDGPTTFSAVHDFAVAHGVAGMASYSESSWTSAGGRVASKLSNATTQINTDFVLTAEHLVPGGAYSAVLVSRTGALCPLGAALDSAAPSQAAPQTFQVAVDSDGMALSEVELTPSASCASGSFNRIGDWSRIDLIFHADNQFHGAAAGPAQWTQLSVPISPLP